MTPKGFIPHRPSTGGILVPKSGKTKDSLPHLDLGNQSPKRLKQITQGHRDRLSVPGLDPWFPNLILAPHLWIHPFSPHVNISAISKMILYQGYISYQGYGIICVPVSVLFSDDFILQGFQIRTFHHAQLFRPEATRRLSC